MTAVSEASLPDALAQAAAAGLRSCAASCRCGRICSRSGDSEHVLLLLLHHIAGDGWSLAPLARDLAARLCGAAATGEAPDLPALPVQYADYTLWQHEVLGAESDPQSAIARQLAFWTETLDELPDQLDLPSDRPRPAVSSYRGDSVPLSLSAELHGRCWRWRARARASLFMVLQAGAGGPADAAGGGQRHPDRQPDCGPHRQRARRPDRVLRQHAGAAHRHRRAIRASAS